MSGRYMLAFGAKVMVRATDCVQIGTDPPRCVVVQDAPSESLQILAGLDGVGTLAELLLRHNADPLLWSTLLEQLLAVELLIPVDQSDRNGVPARPGAHLADELASLTHRYGHDAAGRIMQTRDDALVVVRGSGVVAASTAGMLAAAGVGHVHHDIGRPTERTSSGTTQPRRVSTYQPGGFGGSLRDTYPTVRVHAPAAHQHPTVVVLAGDAVPDLGVAAALTRNRIPHLTVSAGLARAVVGPLVLPGRSSCLSCAHRHRTAADPGWPAVARQLADRTPRAETFLAAAAACLAVREVLQHIDGVAIPSTVNGTLEWRTGDIGARRRTWVEHPECGCRGDP